MTSDTFGELVRHVQQSHTRIAFSDEDGNLAAVLIDAAELDRIERHIATLEVLADPELQAELEEAERDIEAGNTFTSEQILADLKARKARCKDAA